MNQCVLVTWCEARVEAAGQCTEGISGVPTHSPPLHVTRVLLTGQLVKGRRGCQVDGKVLWKRTAGNKCHLAVPEIHVAIVSCNVRTLEFSPAWRVVGVPLPRTKSASDLPAGSEMSCHSYSIPLQGHTTVT